MAKQKVKIAEKMFPTTAETAHRTNSLILFVTAPIEEYDSGDGDEERGKERDG